MTAPKYTRTVAEIGKWLQEALTDIEIALHASKDNPIDRNTKMIEARDSLVHAILNYSSLMSVITTQLNTAFDRVPVRDRVTSDAISTSLLIANGLQDAAYSVLKKVSTDETGERRTNRAAG